MKMSGYGNYNRAAGYPGAATGSYANFGAAYAANPTSQHFGPTNGAYANNFAALYGNTPNTGYGTTATAGYGATNGAYGNYGAPNGQTFAGYGGHPNTGYNTGNGYVGNGNPWTMGGVGGRNHNQNHNVSYRSNNSGGSGNGSGGSGGGGGNVSADRQQRSVFVGNIPYKATETELIQLFSQVGNVVAFRLVSDRDTGRPKGFGFCEYEDMTAAATALQLLNGTELHGRPLRVGSSK